jgi:hypothetical protein
MLKTLFAIIAALLSISAVQGQTSVRIDESKIRAVLENDSTVVVIPIFSSADHTIKAQLSLAWLNTDEKELNSSRQDIAIQPGPQEIRTPLRLSNSSIWTRLRYSLAPVLAEAKSFEPISGILALPHIADYVFQVKLSHTGNAHSNNQFSIYAEAIHPVTQVPIKGVQWNPKLEVNNKELSPTQVKMHDEVFTEFIFDLPLIGSDYEHTEVEVTGRLGDYEQNVSIDIAIENQLSARLQTDKPIYQPGQTIHMRAVILDTQGNAAPDARVQLRIEDQYHRIHNAQLVSSKFGIIQDEWKIPNSADLGIYEIELSTKEYRGYSITHHSVRVSRYELPTFSVDVRPDRDVYLPTEQPRVKITSAYIFGKPVPKGQIKIIRNNYSQRDYRSNTSEASGKVVAEGVAGEDGTFTAQLDLKADHEKLGQSEYERFNDISFTAYYKDVASGGTEQRRFDIRITREPIHVYILPSGCDGSLPFPVYISTSYADGRPASAAVEATFQGRTIKLNTNRYGVGKIYLTFINNDDPDVDRTIKAKAVDVTGATGKWSEGYWNHYQIIRLETSRTIYRAGEPVTLKIALPPEYPADQLILIHAISQERKIASRVVRLKNHNGEVTFPYQPDFQREVGFIAWNAVNPRGNDRYRGRNLGSKTVIFSDGSDLKVSAETERRIYKPGGKASVQMKVASRDGRPVEAAIGLALVDQAVLERARTEREFGNRGWFSCAFCDDSEDLNIGGIHLKDLYLLKQSSENTPDIDLIAEALLAKDNVRFYTDDNEIKTEGREFKKVSSQMDEIEKILDDHYSDTLEFPEDDSTLTKILEIYRHKIQLEDPWGMPYSVKFGVEYQDRIIKFLSVGPDKQPGTGDEFVVKTFKRPYFKPIQYLIYKIFKKLDDYPATESEFIRILSEHGLLLNSLFDPWGTPYKVKIETSEVERVISIISSGPDRTYKTSDDVMVDFFTGRYFQKEETKISAALKNAGLAPQNRYEFQKILNESGIEISSLRDAWNHPYEINEAIRSFYNDQIEKTNTRTDIIPVTQWSIVFSIHSVGPDGLNNTDDDFDVAAFPVFLKEEAIQHPDASTDQSGFGDVIGRVVDTSFAVLPGATVILVNKDGVKYETLTSSIGTFGIKSLPVGVYTIRAFLPSFESYEASNLVVEKNKTTRVDIKLFVSFSEATVEVVTSAEPKYTSTSAVKTESVSVSTPRVREYFPETLFWAPEIITDPNGQARVEIPLADTVTTWKVAAIVSTMDGRIAETESDFRTFQPFFLDFNPPPVLTEGDQIKLPVTVRNYQDRDQKVNVRIEPNGWSLLQGNSTQVITVPSNNSVNVNYSVQAKKVSEKATQRIIAEAGSNSDAIEKSLRIHPDGQAVTQTYGDLISGHSLFTAEIPQNAITGATRGEIRLYPNITSLLLESASAILQKPYGCAEQTISAGYANLIAWRYAKATGIKDIKIEKYASEYVRSAVESLSRFESGGGISYWIGGEPDAAVTAYALNFLIEASAIIPVNQEDTRYMVTWLEWYQKKSGQWIHENVGADQQERRTLLLTASVARALAAAQKAGIKVKPETLSEAFHQLAKFTDSIDEPYMLANFIMAVLDSGEEALLGASVKRLAALGREEKGGLYWDLQTNSPFYGWGTAGRYETTGLVVSALSAWYEKHPESKELEALIRRGLVFLLRGRGDAGWWYSTQATLSAMRAITDASQALGGFGIQGGTIEVRSNGKIVKTIEIPDNSQSMDPVLLDLSLFIASGENKIELMPSSGMKAALVLVSSTYWRPWEQTKVRTSPELRLDVKFDRLEAKAGQLIRCSVKAERVGFRGYGMMLAEIGLPPGADVDRASLESAIKDYSLGVEQYEILPDRVVLYLWPTAGGSSFDFSFSLRSPMKAKSAPSILYDYYNPEALVEIPPFQWMVK